MFGEVIDGAHEFLSLFFIVEFQKFLISLSVLPGKWAAIFDHLKKEKRNLKTKIRILSFIYVV